MGPFVNNTRPVMPSTRKPVIGVISCTRTVEGEDAYIVKTRYVDALAKHADAVPLICPAITTRDDADAMLARLDAILLTGSNSNIEPHHYGAASGRAPYDPGRDTMSALLIKAAVAAGKPVFGICRGLQEINVALGGTLVDQRDGAEPPELPHHAPDDASLEQMFGHSHPIDVVADTPLAAITGEPTLTINSVHFQTIGALGAGLVVNARAKDGVVEAVSSVEGPTKILAVQWHPEWQPETRLHDLAFWQALGEITRDATAR
ncbi:MAG: putative glutamine amidotransferase [Devosia sp.]|mgnify:FL=1|jgi:putative glutamine amidotransferase|tara:strand:+ start:2072 stop:2857 length:786 start_codon:yes stop_codon:yes gene_type:complete